MAWLHAKLLIIKFPDDISVNTEGETTKVKVLVFQKSPKKWFRWNSTLILYYLFLRRGAHPLTFDSQAAVFTFFEWRIDFEVNSMMISTMTFDFRKFVVVYSSVNTLELLYDFIKAFDTVDHDLLNYKKDYTNILTAFSKIVMGLLN